MKAIVKHVVSGLLLMLFLMLHAPSATAEIRDIRVGDKPLTGELEQINLSDIKGPIVQSTTKLAIEGGNIIYAKSHTFVKIKPSSSPASFHSTAWYEKIVSFEHKMLVADTGQTNLLFFVDLAGGDVISATDVLIGGQCEKLVATISAVKKKAPNDKVKLDEMLQEAIKTQLTKKFIESL